MINTSRADPTLLEVEYEMDRQSMIRKNQVNAIDLDNPFVGVVVLFAGDSIRIGDLVVQLKTATSVVVPGRDYYRLTETDADGLIQIGKRDAK